MIGEHIQELRHEKGFTLSELADKSNVAKSYLSAIERGLQGNPSVQVLERIATVLDVSVQHLVSGGEVSSEEVSLDREWIDLTREVAESGITKEQFREWLEFQRWRIQRGDRPD